MSTPYTFVQLYEIQTPIEAEALLELGVDHIGSVILSAACWKDAAIRDTVRLTRAAGACSSLIPLFSTPAAVMHMLDFYRPDIVHFCDTLSDANGPLEKCRELIALQRQVRESFPETAIMRSIPIAPPGEARRVPTLELAALFQSVSDFFLTDTLLPQRTLDSGPAAQPVAGFIGITGRTCDWSMARRLVDTARIPVILAGGISPDNVAEGLRHVRPAGVDSCTGTNARDDSGKPIRFKKDIGRVRDLVEAVREIDLRRQADDPQAKSVWRARGGNGAHATKKQGGYKVDV
ncbi:MAG: hypothetical protein WAM61_12450 [Desulfobacterales bacterium]